MCPEDVKADDDVIMMFQRKLCKQWSAHRALCMLGQLNEHPIAAHVTTLRLTQCHRDHVLPPNNLLLAIASKQPLSKLQAFGALALDFVTFCSPHLTVTGTLAWIYLAIANR